MAAATPARMASAAAGIGPPGGGAASAPAQVPAPDSQPGWPEWLPPFAVAALAWNLMAVLGALASYGDAQHAAAPPSLAATLLRYVLQHLPLSVLSLLLAIAWSRAHPLRLRPAQLLGGCLAALLALVPLLCIWQSAVNRVFDGRALAGLPQLLAQQGLLTWWFDAVMLTVAFGGHLAYGAWRRAHTETLAWQHAQQVNLSLRLRLLQGQLEPYFLSGVLADIGRMVRAGQRGQATRALARLSDLLRYALRASRSDWQSVADEVRFLRDYVELQELCQGRALPLNWQLQQGDWSDRRCPPLLLFPLLEQALRACPAGGAPSASIQFSIGLARGPDARQVQVEVCYPGRASGDPLPAGLRARLDMLFHGAAALSSEAGAGVTWLRMAYPVADHDD